MAAQQKEKVVYSKQYFTNFKLLLPGNERKRTYYLLTRHGKTSKMEILSVMLCTSDASEFWVARQKMSKIRAPSMEMNDEEFRRHVFESLMLHNTSYRYRVKELEPERKKFKMEIAWNSKENKISILIAQLEFSRMKRAEGAERLLLLVNSHLAAKRVELKREREKTNNLFKLREAQEKLIGDAVQAKNDIEEELLRKFVDVLNAKKQKIRDLLTQNKNLRKALHLERERNAVDHARAETPPKDEEEFENGAGNDVRELHRRSDHADRKYSNADGLLTGPDDLQSAGADSMDSQSFHRTGQKKRRRETREGDSVGRDGGIGLGVSGSDIGPGSGWGVSDEKIPTRQRPRNDGTGKREIVTLSFGATKLAPPKLHKRPRTKQDSEAARVSAPQPMSPDRSYEKEEDSNPEVDAPQGKPVKCQSSGELFADMA
ncbi:hypothetical protein AAMO2058_000360000 [Amorphochlora amoebiformis]|eukprot:1329301-Amorphochlora_amoeboformis.AAC.1